MTTGNAAWYASRSAPSEVSRITVATMSAVASEMESIIAGAPQVWGAHAVCRRYG